MASLYVMNITVAAERIASLVARLGTSAELEVSALSYAEVGSEGWRLYAYFSDPPDRAALAAILKSELGPDTPLPDPLIEEVVERDWVAKVQKDLPPVRAGRFLIHGSHDRGRVIKSIHRVEIDAGQAFGTGHHGTTKGCLCALDKLLRRRRFERIGDIGTGSGILAAAAAKALPGITIVASDNDPVAVRVATDNFRLNGARSQAWSVLAGGFHHPHLRRRRIFDLLFANLLAGPLKSLARDVSGALKTNGYAILSGILDQQARTLEGHYRNFGFIVESRCRINGWTTLILRKASLKRKNRRTGFREANLSGS